MALPILPSISVLTWALISKFFVYFSHSLIHILCISCSFAKLWDIRVFIYVFTFLFSYLSFPDTVGRKFSEGKSTWRLHLLHLHVSVISLKILCQVANQWPTGVNPSGFPFCFWDRASKPRLIHLFHHSSAGNIDRYTPLYPLLENEPRILCKLLSAELHSQPYTP